MLKLTNRIVDQAAPREREYLIRDIEIPGFIVRVYRNGVKTYFYRFKNLSGVERRLKLGRYRVDPQDEWLTPGGLTWPEVFSFCLPSDCWERSR